MRTEDIVSDVCGAVESVLSACRPGISGPGEPRDIFAGRGRIGIGKAMTRQLLFHVLHDRFGWSYGRVARLSGISCRNVKRGVGRARDLVFIDPLYMEAMRIIDDNLWRN